MRIQINEPWVVYFFSKFHEQLGFEKIINVQTSYPDCTALKESKEVSIEFESKSSHLQTHLEYDEVNLTPARYDLTENQKEIIFKERIWDKMTVPFEPLKLSKERYYLMYPENHWYPNKYWRVMKKHLDLDYCVAWEVYQVDVNREAYKNVQFIELKSSLMIKKFLEKNNLEFA